MWDGIKARIRYKTISKYGDSKTIAVFVNNRFTSIIAYKRGLSK